ncbi:hypothetical protein IVB22_39045 [Bradyrhizobium sp. 190]|uniref:hypothetical protein n=1 Tax=Bradyrhizobium sp. 190 TaxID=2782658 RepID=UPI001FFBC5C3|nr:hypothetical protein [Bradyrhizobium sp. 190]MCK1518371.1 hypothetical protein [Bradyrhizobium sp. 190]
MAPDGASQGGVIAVKNDAPMHHFTKFLARRLQIEPTRIRSPTFNWVFITGWHPAKSLIEDRV